MLGAGAAESLTVPRVLIVDDDPVSLHFLATAISGFDCGVVAVASGAAALTAVRWAAFDLLLIDRRLPDMSGTQLLAALRAGNVGAPALATSAELDAALVEALRSAGFADAIAKPVSITALHAQLQPHLPRDAQPAVLDDASAASAVGSDVEALRALRRLFAAELSELESDCSRDARAPDAERLHRLRASCGFCGATALGDAALRLETALRGSAPDTEALRREFLRLCETTRASLVSGSGA